MLAKETCFTISKLSVHLNGPTTDTQASAQSKHDLADKIPSRRGTDAAYTLVRSHLPCYLQRTRMAAPCRISQTLHLRFKSCEDSKKLWTIINTQAHVDLAHIWLLEHVRQLQ